MTAYIMPAYIGNAEIEKLLARLLKECPKDYDTIREIERRLWPSKGSRL